MISSNNSMTKSYKLTWLSDFSYSILESNHKDVKKDSKPWDVKKENVL